MQICVFNQEQLLLLFRAFIVYNNNIQAAGEVDTLATETMANKESGGNTQRTECLICVDQKHVFNLLTFQVYHVIYNYLSPEMSFCCLLYNTFEMNV